VSSEAPDEASTEAQASRMTAVQIRPVTRARVHQQVVGQLQELMLDGTLNPGDRLPPERELAQRFGVSRVAIRQALSVLQAIGLIESRIGDGTFARRSAELTVTAFAMVRPGPQGSIGEQLELRRVIEPQVAELAAQRANPSDVAELRRCLAAQEEKHVAGLSFVDEDSALHLAIARTTKNHLLVRMIEGIHELLRESRQSSLLTPEGRARSIAGHRSVIEAIEQQDSLRAKEAMLLHVSDVEALARKHDRSRSRVRR